MNRYITAWIKEKESRKVDINNILKSIRGNSGKLRILERRNDGMREWAIIEEWSFADFARKFPLDIKNEKSHTLRIEMGKILANESSEISSLLKEGIKVYGIP